ncbi:hypothetical protein BASA50_001642 [Batrachochytrium salamandrivorans]|uniref:Adenylate kinase n=1 Tax=Batrachochytrium salamandrivorans TaxID=1357716 RepID=A0ABQ8FNI3_9FUNG|nr:hypothetical protein BASA60_007028 [Batrachochytrium salamandrivorans]KAH6601372.1 hypothetical protein BASA50_001642 [Batrachochytrium salamandrivorans]
MEMELTPEAVLEVLGTIPTTPEIQVTHRHVYYIIGKPSCGKTTLATSLADYIDAKSISPITALTQALSENAFPDRHQLLEILANGDLISPEKIIQIMQKEVNSDVAEYKGYVIDGLSCNSNFKNVVNLVSSPFDITFLKKTLDEKAKGHIPVLIRLQISDENLIRRRAAQWIDPSTNIGYSGQQVLYSRMRRSQGLKEGTDDLAASLDVERLLHDKDGSSKNITEAAVMDGEDSDSNEDIEDSNTADNDILNQDLDKLKTNMSSTMYAERLKIVQNKKSWDMISEQILDRLIKRPEDDPLQSPINLAEYHKIEEDLNDIQSNYFDGRNVIDLDATQHPDVVFNQLKSCLAARNLSIYSIPVEATRLYAPEGGVTGLTDSDIIQHYISLNIKKYEPQRGLGHFKKFCPVTLYNTNELVEGDLKYAALYRGGIYVFISDDYADKFVKNPNKFLSKQYAVSNIRASFIGTPLSGKSTQARLLAEKYCLTCISLDSIFEKLEEMNLNPQERKCTPGEYKDLNNIFFNKIMENLRNGSAITIELLTETIKLIVNQAAMQGKNGWVLDGYPRTAEQARALVSAGIVPKLVFNLINDINNPSTISRSSIICKNSPGDTTQGARNTGVTLFPQLLQLYNNHNNELPEILKIMEEVDAKIVEINADKTIATLINQIICSINPFTPSAVSLSIFPSTDVKLEVGITNYYCPVTLKQEKRLIKGNKSISAQYQNLAYYFATQEARTEFLQLPFVFVHNIKIPPPRLVFMGPEGSGKTTCIQFLSKKWGIPHVKFDTLLYTYTSTFEQEKSEEMQNPYKDDDIVPPSILLKIFSSIFVQEPYASKGYLIEGFPYTKIDLETTIKGGYMPDAFVILSVDAEIATKRAINSRKSSMVNSIKVPAAQMNQELDNTNNFGIHNDPQTIEPIDSIVPDDELFETIMSKIKNESLQISDLSGFISESDIVPVIEIDTSTCIRPILALLQRKLCQYLENRHCLLSSAVLAKAKQADLLLKLGTKSYSPIGKYCPVTLKLCNDSYLDIFGKHPVIFQNHIYFLKDVTARQEFISRPLDFILYNAPQSVVYPMIYILGGPKSGKTYLSESLSLELKITHITVPSAIQAIIDGEEVTSLYDNLKLALESGSPIPDELVIEAILLITSRTISSGRGWVLDGFPETNEQAIILEQRGLLPQLILELTIDRHELNGRLKSDIAQNASQSKWAIKDAAFVAVKERLKKQRVYLDCKSKGQAAPIYGVSLSKPHINSNIGAFGDYCPVSLIKSNKLVRVSPGSLHMAEYQGLFYHFSGPVELDSFLCEPEKFVRDTGLPEHLPVLLSRSGVKALFPRQLELKGYCPVSFSSKRSGNTSSIVMGDADCTVEYAGKLYAMHSASEMLQFMESPWKYVDQILPKKLPPPHFPCSIRGLPIIGYMEQAISASITNALYDLGKVKPKFPYLSIDLSACKYLALYLKAHNPNSRDWVRNDYSKRLHQFKEKCAVMRSLMSAFPHISQVATKPERDVKLDSLLDDFISLKPHSARTLA